MGWLILFGLLTASFLALRLLRVRGGLLTAALAALVLGAAGYALQGCPDLPARTVQASAEHEYISLTGARHAFYGNFSPEEPWLRMSEALARSGNSENAVGILQNAVGKYPGSPQLWVGLGNALVDHARGLTPAAQLAFERAAELSPGYPAPTFFYGLALARSGDRQGALDAWTQVLQTAPEDASWRPLVEGGIAAISRPTPQR